MQNYKFGNAIGKTHYSPSPYQQMFSDRKSVVWFLLIVLLTGSIKLNGCYYGSDMSVHDFKLFFSCHASFQRD